jgi:hypothetical protein
MGRRQQIFEQRERGQLGLTLSHFVFVPVLLLDMIIFEMTFRQLPGALPHRHLHRKIFLWQPALPTILRETWICKGC